MRVLGIDYGSKKIGLALSDPSGRVAWPYRVLDNSMGAVEELRRICRDEGVELVVVGEAVDLRRRANPLWRSSRDFADRLTAASGLPLVWETEWFTTVEARRLASGSGRDRRDDVAASLILKNYLEKRRSPLTQHD